MMDVIDILSQTVGVTPSRQWLDACRAFLQENGDSETTDAILFQILHTDIRDVVRPISNNDELRHREQQQQQSSSERLRAAIKDSQTKRHPQQRQPLVPSNSNVNNSSSPPSFLVTTLDKSFRLLCQVEELLDVSLNAESRLAVGPASANNPTPVGNQRLRCLKLCLSDGYDGQPIIAMEVSPIPSLSVNSKAGLKIILIGPIQVRWGMLQCHSGNTHVVGGEVEDLVEFQQKALAQAKQLAGVGCDPTIRALIGTAPLESEEDDQDEGEGESGDVVAPPAPPVAPLAPAPIPPITVPHAPTATTTLPGATRVAPFVPSHGGGQTFANNSIMPPPSNRSKNPFPRLTAGPPPPPPTTTTTTTQTVPNPFAVTRNITASATTTTTNPYSNIANASSGPTPASSLLRQSLPRTNPYAQSSNTGDAQVNIHNNNNNDNPYAVAPSTSATNPYGRSSSSNPVTNSTSMSAQHHAFPPSANPYATNRARSNVMTANTSILPTNTTTFVKASELADTVTAGASNQLSNQKSSSNVQASVPIPSRPSVPMNVDAMVDLTESPPSARRIPAPRAPVTPPPPLPPTSNTGVPKAVLCSAQVNMSALTPSSNVETVPRTVPCNAPVNMSALTPCSNMEIDDSQPYSIATSSTTAFTSVPDQKMSFDNLRTLVIQLLANEEMYKSYYGLTFTVPLVQKGGLLGFNIVKRADRKKKKGSKIDSSSGQDKYEIEMVTHFAGPSGEDKITCRIASNLVEPFFGLPLGEIRKLNRTDRAKGNQIVHEGGVRVRNTLFTPGTWRVTLARSPHEMFPSGQVTILPSIDDPKMPILLLRQKEDK